MRGQGMRHLWHGDRLWHEDGWKYGFSCLDPNEPLRITELLDDLARCFVRFTPAREDGDRYDEYLSRWRLRMSSSVNVFIARTQDEMLWQLDFTIAYLMWGEPRAHGCLDSGL